MSLLSALNLPTPKHFLPPGGGAMPPPPLSGAPAMPTPVARSGAKPVGGDAGDPRAEALKLRDAIEARRRQTADLLLRMRKVEPVLKARLEAASGDEKKKLAEQQALLGKKIADAERVVLRAEADLKAIDNPGSKREELVAVIARQRSPAKVADAGEIGVPGPEPQKQGKADPNGGQADGKERNLVKKDLERDKTFKSKGGAKLGIVGGLHANVTCKVGAPTGEPKLYPVTLTVSFGASVGVSVKSGDKKDAKVSGSIEVKGSQTNQMVLTHDLNEAELAEYTRLLESASKGTPVADPRREFAIIASGANPKMGWEIARRMYEGQSTKDVADGLKRKGDSAELSKEKTGSIDAKGGYGPVKGGVKVSQTKKNSIAMKRNDKGGIDAEGKQEYSEEKSGSVEVKAGVVGLEIGGTKVHKMRTGYEFEIDPKNDPDGKILEELKRCESDAEYMYFMAKYNTKVKRIGTTVGQTDTSGYNVGVTVGGKTFKIGNDKGVETDEKLDAKGRVKSKKSTGHNNSGGELANWADSKREEAMAETDSDGTSFKVEETQTQNYGDRAKERKKEQKKAEKAGGKPGNKDDAAEKNVSGIGLSNTELERLGRAACNSLDAWNGWCSVSSAKEDWKKAGIAIKKGSGTATVVGHELVRFVGGDIDRKKVVQSLARGAQTKMGKAFEFPDSLRDVRDDYDLVTDDKLGKKMDTYANKNGDPAAAKECQRLLAIVDRIQPRVQACKDFSNLATKTEMLSRLQEKRTLLAQSVKGYNGDLKPENDPKLLGDEGNRLMKVCNAHGVAQATLVEKLADHDAITVSEKIAGKKLVKQLEDLQYRWRSDFYRLKENYAKRKLVLNVLPYAPGVPQVAPTESLVAVFEKKFAT